jgi:hypothetical protein
MTYFQKVIIKSNEKLLCVRWLQDCTGIIVLPVNGVYTLYRAFNPYICSAIELYFETENTNHTISFQMDANYVAEIILTLIVSSDTNEIGLYINDTYKAEIY